MPNSAEVSFIREESEEGKGKESQQAYKSNRHKLPLQVTQLKSIAEPLKPRSSVVQVPEKRTSTSSVHVPEKHKKGGEPLKPSLTYSVCNSSVQVPEKCTSTSSVHVPENRKNGGEPLKPPHTSSVSNSSVQVSGKRKSIFSVHVPEKRKNGGEPLKPPHTSSEQPLVLPNTVCDPPQINLHGPQGPPRYNLNISETSCYANYYNPIPPQFNPNGCPTTKDSTSNNAKTTEKEKRKNNKLKNPATPPLHFYNTSAFTNYNTSIEQPPKMPNAVHHPPQFSRNGGHTTKDSTSNNAKTTEKVKSRSNKLENPSTPPLNFPTTSAYTNTNTPRQQPPKMPNAVYHPPQFNRNGGHATKDSTSNNAKTTEKVKSRSNKLENPSTPPLNFPTTSAYTNTNTPRQQPSRMPNAVHHPPQFNRNGSHTTKDSTSNNAKTTEKVKSRSNKLGNPSTPPLNFPTTSAYTNTNTPRQQPSRMPKAVHRPPQFNPHGHQGPPRRNLNIPETSNCANYFDPIEEPGVMPNTPNQLPNTSAYGNYITPIQQPPRMSNAVHHPPQFNPHEHQGPPRRNLNIFETSNCANYFDPIEEPGVMPNTPNQLPNTSAYGNYITPIQQPRGLPNAVHHPPQFNAHGHQGPPRRNLNIPKTSYYRNYYNPMEERRVMPDSGNHRSEFNRDFRYTQERFSTIGETRSEMRETSESMRKSRTFFAKYTKTSTYTSQTMFQQPLVMPNSVQRQPQFNPHGRYTESPNMENIQLQQTTMHNTPSNLPYSNLRNYVQHPQHIIQHNRPNFPPNDEYFVTRRQRFHNSGNNRNSQIAETMPNPSMIAFAQASQLQQNEDLRALQQYYYGNNSQN